jgi:hypothetical protein
LECVTSSVLVPSSSSAACTKYTTVVLIVCFFSLSSSVQVLHEDGELPVCVPELPLHRLALQDEGADLDQVLVALHAFVVTEKREEEEEEEEEVVSRALYDYNRLKLTG